MTSYNKSRKLLIDNYKIDTIVDLGDAVFDDAVTTAVVIVAEKEVALEDHKIVISDKDRKNTNTINQQALKDRNYVIATNINEEKDILINKIEQNSIPLGSICAEMIFGIVITKNKDEVISDTPRSGWKPFLEGKDIAAYSIKSINKFINYDAGLLHRARTKEIFEQPEKILLQRITGGSRPLKAAYDNMQYYNKESINNIILKNNYDYSYKYILGLLNSKLINWYYSNMFTNESRLTVNLSKEYLSQIPIPVADKVAQVPFIILVDYILALSGDLSAVTIDDFVPNTFLITIFEEILDAIIFELVFKKDFLDAEIKLSEYILSDFKPITQKLSFEEQKVIIFEAYQMFRRKDSMIRNNLKLMDLRLSEIVMPIKKISYNESA